MNLTESGAGSDLGPMKTRAVPNGDHYLISGQKIYITWGDHDAADNIVHLVLAQAAGRARGLRGYLPVPGAQVPGQRRRLPRGSATTSIPCPRSTSWVSTAAPPA
jgi:alkylation response protein AidB-like acyl-CoA dehydrogenase